MLPQRNSNWVSRDQNKTQNSSHPPHSLTADEKHAVMEALDHLHVTKQYQGMGCCTVCKKISLKKCSACSTYYCSSECQTFDWPKHRHICAISRDNTSDGGSRSSSKQMRCSFSVKNFNEESYTISNRGSPFIALTKQLSKKSGSVINDGRTFADLKIANKQYQNRDPKSKAPNQGQNDAMKDNKKNNTIDRKKSSPKRSQSSKKSSPEDKKSVSSNKRKSNSNRQDACYKTLSSIENVPERNVISSNVKGGLNSTKTGKIEVIAMYRQSSNRYWVMPINHLETYEEIQLVLNKECKNYEAAIPKVGLVCGCTFVGEWFRGKILVLSPDPIVHFIDYGNVSNYDVKVFKQLPESLQNQPGLAFQIEFEKGTPKQYETEDLETLKFTIEETSKTVDGISRVKIIEGKYGATESPLQLAKPPDRKKSQKMNVQKGRSVMDNISVNSNGMLFFVHGEGRIRFASIVPDNNKEASDSLERVLKIESPDSAPIKAKSGDYVLVTDKEGNDQRGRVVLRISSIHYVLLIDCGNVISTETVYPLPENLKELIELGVIVTVEEIISPDQMKEMEPCFFAVTGEPVSGKWPCTLRGSKQQIIAKVLLEKPVEKADWRPKFAFIKSGSTVEVSSVCSPNSLYVRPVDVETEQKFLDMNMELIQYAPKAKNFDLPPSPGEFCCAKFEEDGCFYRAIVNAVEDNKVWVLFVDFGNEQKTDLKDLKPLPESLKNVTIFAAKVRLKNVSPKPWNNMIKDYIGKLNSDNVELTLTYAESLNNGVILREKVSGVIVNDFIEKARDKSAIISERPVPKKSEVFLDDDMKFTTLTPGSTCNLAILFVGEYEFKSGHTFWATTVDVENFSYVNVELSSLICEHCEGVSTPYEPTFRELCLAEFEGSWYRAMCIGLSQDMFKVFFVDFGNCCEVKRESIRKMQKEFLKAPALAMSCTLSGRDRLKGKPELTQEIYSKLLDRINTFIRDVTVTKFENDTFVLEIPEIEAILSR